ncbi:U-box domain-containing protein 36-like [Miscanthus floridulus]|uniref:U-box domain-containing protein 36-like n=1 Tax=Miscanthus floridulus TaxID=154761 RepID=UPI00345AC355
MHEATVSRPAWEKVYLAVGDDAKQCELSLQWALSFIPPQMSLVLLHVNRSVTVIPYEVLGAPVKASMLKEEFVSNYSKNARNKIETSLRERLQNFKVQAKILIIDRHDVAPALLELVKKRKITTLIMGAKSRHDWKSKTAVALEKQADPSCNILYLHDGITIV